MDPITPPAARLTLSADEAAEALGICRNSVYSAIKSGDIPSVRIGRRTLIPRRAFERMLEAKLAGESV